MKALELSRTDRLLLGILLPLALATALITWLAMPPRKEGSIVRQPSTFFNTGSGTKAAFLVLDRLGYRVSQLRMPISRESLAGSDALMILEPVLGYEKDERKILQEWVKEGHTLVIAPGMRKFSAALAGANPTTNWYFDNWFNCPEVTGGGPRPDTVTARPGDSLRDSDPLAAGIDQVVARTEFRFPTTTALKGPLGSLSSDEFWMDDYGVVALRVRYGNGKIIALADTYWLSNRGLSEGDNALLLSNLATEATGRRGAGAIAFDETHHGFVLHGSPWQAIVRLMLEEHWGWGLVQAALVALVALYGAAVRFGRPRDIQQRVRRQHGEFAEAAGHTLHSAGANEIAFRTLFTHYRTHLAKRMHLPHDTSARELGEAVAARTGLDIVGLIEEADTKMNGGRIKRLEVLQMAAEFHRIAEILSNAS